MKLGGPEVERASVLLVRESARKADATAKQSSAESFVTLEWACPLPDCFDMIGASGVVAGGVGLDDQKVIDKASLV